MANPWFGSFIGGAKQFTSIVAPALVFGNPRKHSALYLSADWPSIWIHLSWWRFIWLHRSRWIAQMDDVTSFIWWKAFIFAGYIDHKQFVGQSFMCIFHRTSFGELSSGNGGFLSHRTHHPFIDWDFPWNKPSIFGYFHDYGNFHFMNSPVYPQYIPVFSHAIPLGATPLTMDTPHDYGFLSRTEMGRGTRGTNRRVLRRMVGMVVLGAEWWSRWWWMMVT